MAYSSDRSKSFFDWYLYYSLFFGNFVKFKAIGGKYAYFLPIGEKICIFPPFFIPFQSFFSPNMVFGNIFANKQTKKYTPLQFINLEAGVYIEMHIFGQTENVQIYGYFTTTIILFEA